MINRNSWAVAACLIMLSGFACGQTQGNNQQSNGQQQNTQSEEKKAGPSKPDIGLLPIQSKAPDESATQAKIYEPDCRKPKDQPEADLCTQRRVANAAEESLQYSAAQTVIGALGVLFVVVTLGYTARANKAAAIAAQAAIDAVNTERAWICQYGFDTALIVDGIMDGVVQPNLVAISLRVNNSGRSPAVGLILNIGYKLVDYNDLPPKYQLDRPDLVGAIVGPGMSVSSTTIALKPDDLKNIMESKKTLYVYLLASYYTTNDPKNIKETKFCAFVEINGYKHDSEGKIVPNISLVPVGSHNSVT